MKLRYLIPVVVAVIAIFTGCKSEDDPIYLSNVNVSSSYVSLSKDGGSTSISVAASSDWSIEKSTVPDWLTISPMTGAAGDQTVTFSAKAGGKREATIKLNCAGQTQEINVLQYAEETNPTIISIKEAVAMIKAGTQPATAVYFKGTVCKVQEISPQYGNATYFMSDDGTFGADNWLEVYRGKWLKGANYTTGSEFSVGDEMVVKGVLIDYNGTPETQQGTAEVVTFTPSLIKVDSLDVKELPIEGGVVKAALTCKGNGITVSVPEDAQNWLSIIGIDTNSSTVSFRALPNKGGDRSTTVTFKTNSDGKTYSAQSTITQKGAILEAPISDFLAAAVGDTQYRLTGIVMELYSSDKQGQSFYIQDYSGKTLVYRAAGFKESGAKVGDVVTVVGKRGAYKDTPQLVSGTFETVKYAVSTVTIAEFREKADDKEIYYMISGTVGKSEEEGTKYDLEKYGNFALTDATGSVYIYGVTPGWGGAKGTFGTLGVAEGDKLTIVAYKTSYKGLVEGVGMFFSNEKAQ